MPTAKQMKRGREMAVAADTAAVLAPELSDEDASAAAAVAEAEETPAQRAKRMFLMAAVQEPAPAAKHSGGGNLASVEGVVISTRDEVVQGAKKLRVFVAVDKIIGAGCKDIITTGIDGFAWGLPSKHLEASPDEVAKNKHAKGAHVMDIGDGQGGQNYVCKANYLGSIQASFYKPEEGAVAAVASAGDKGGGKGKEMDLTQIVPGMRVLLSAVSCVQGKTGEQIYTNAKRIAPIGAPLHPHQSAARIIEEATGALAQPTAAMLWSMAAGGFFGGDYGEAALQQQVEACRRMWTQVHQGAIAKLEQVALDFGKDPSTYGQETAGNLTAQATRLKSMMPQDLATHTPVFLTDLQKDTKTPYSAWLVQQGVAPGDETTAMCGALFDDAAALPNAFVEAKVKDVSFKGNLVQVDFRLFFVFDKASALVALGEGKNPVLHTTKPAASVKFSKRSAGPEMVGSLSDAKIEMACKEVLPFANTALHANVFPRSIDDAQVDGHFASTAGINWVDGVQKVGVQISEAFLVKEMLGGLSGYFFRQPEGIALVEPQSGDLKAPTLKRCGIEALTERAFEFSQLEVPVDKVRRYHVVYAGCAGDVAANNELATSVDAGEAHLAEVVAAIEDEDGLTMQNFLRHRCIVYAVAA